MTDPSPSPLTVFVAIGNSDDKLSQADWAAFCADINDLVKQSAVVTHGEWHSLPDSRYQNACWGFEAWPNDMAYLRKALSIMAGHYGQDSIALSLARTELVTR